MGAVENSVRPTTRKYVDKDGKKKTVTLTTKESNDEAGMNKGGIPKKNFAKPGSYSSAYNKGGMTMRKGNMAYNKGGMGKAKTGHSDYRKGGMVYTTKGKK